METCISIYLSLFIANPRLIKYNCELVINTVCRRSEQYIIEFKGCRFLWLQYMRKDTSYKIKNLS